MEHEETPVSFALRVVVENTQNDMRCVCVCVVC